MQSRVAELFEVLEDIKDGRYMRTMVTKEEDGVNQNTSVYTAIVLWVSVSIFGTLKIISPFLTVS